MRRLTFAVMEDGLVLSRLIPAEDGLCIAFPVLDYDGIGKDEAGNFSGDFTGPLTYNLEKMGIEAIYGLVSHWTKKIPLAIKNEHRTFWGMKPFTPSRRNLPPKQAEILALLDAGPKTEPELAAATNRRARRAHPLLLTLESKGLVRFDYDLLKWRTV